MIYLLDTNVIGDLLSQKLPFTHLSEVMLQNNRICICTPVYFETLRGLTKAQSVHKTRAFKEQIIPMLEWVELRHQDWEFAAQYWAITSRAGRQLSDMDLLIGAIAARLNATLVTADNDFDALPIRRENWRLT